MAWYNDGTITVTNGSKIVTGVDTQFLSNIRNGAILMIGPKLRVINDIISDTELQLEVEYDGPTQTGIVYEIIRNWQDTSPTELARRIDNFLTDRQRSMDEFVTWVNGTYNGGKNSDGKYPLTDRYGVVRLVKSPARMEYETGGPGNGGGTGDLTGAGIYLASAFGVMGGLGIDETDNINLALKDLEAKGGGKLIVRSHNGIDPIFIDGLIAIENHNITLEFASDIVYGSKGWMRISGGLAEIRRPGQTELLKLRVKSYAREDGLMVLPMRENNGSFLQVGDRITVRGENDKNGKVIEKQVTIVKEIIGDDCICTDEPDYTFEPTYPNSEFPDDWTTGTTISISVYSAMTGDIKNTDVIPVVDTAGFFPGDLVYISDARTERDVMNTTPPANLLSAAVMEICRIAAIEGNNIRLERAVRREYLTAWSAGVTKMDAIKNSHIKLRGVTWNAPQPDRKAHGAAINYGWGCTVKVDEMQGRGGRKGIGVRVAYAYDCHVLESKIYDAFSFGSAEGYGISLYYSTMCSIRFCNASGNRHNYLLQTSTSCEILDNHSNDDYISGIDLHGAGSVDCRVMRNRCSRSKSYADGVTNGGAIRNGNTSHTIGDHRTVIADNYIEGYLDTKCAAIDVSPSSQDVIVRNNDVVDCRVGFRHYKINSGISPVQRANRVTLEGNNFTRVEQILDVNNYANSVFDEVILIGNKSIENKQHFVVKNIPKVLAMENKIIRPVPTAGAHAFEFDGCGNVKAYSNYAGEAARAFKITGTAYAKLVRNMLDDCTESTGITDGGGNGTVISLQNTDVPAGGGGTAAPVKMTRIDGTLAVNATSTDPVNINTDVPSIANGLTAVQGQVSVAVGSLIEVYAIAPYVSMGGTTGPVTAHLWADGVRVATSVDRITASGGAENTGGKDFVLVGVFYATEEILDLVMKIGPNSNANTIMMNSKWGGASQPYIIVKEYPQ
ncbi:particle-associated lyase [Pseudomonas phage nickie]|uniref:Particle-associated lyase n=1 Tax=Pseudomonas phage nickie TaxID=2048977 RepID=A0A2H4P7F7_9CAUD|nr:tail fiber protein [Pseudomonas phage nickie]ATW57970.1 particle-associated lyase [Pseudomonas phage nickie]